uniref:hypothetical protein n=1 Tax=Clostridium sp. NkU-1 TaxID=1095009 RepID=UPI000ABC07E3
MACYNSWGNPDKELEYESKCIKVLEGWQTNDSYDLLIVYANRTSYYSFRDDDKAMEDYRTAIEWSSSYPELASLFY